MTSNPDPGPDRGFVLKPVHVPGIPVRVEIDEATGLSIGRSSDNALVLDGERFAQVSSHHARLSVQEGRLVLEDLGSLNGTLANGTPVDRCTLSPGDVIQLGRAGPRFVVEEGADLTATTIQSELPELEPIGPAHRRFGESTVIHVKKALGIAPETDVRQIVETTERRGRRSLYLATGLVATAAALALFWLWQRSDEDVQRLESLNAYLAAEVAKAQAAADQNHQAWLGDRTALESERDSLQERISRLEIDEQQATAEIESLRAQLGMATEKLKLFDPINLEQTRLDGVRRVRSAVVFIEAQIVLRDSKTGNLLHVEEDPVTGERSPNLRDVGEVLANESSGSGFVVSADGHILTNAHVVEPDGFDDRIEMKDGSVLVAEVQLSVLFDRSPKRHRARVLRTLHAEDDDDLAVIQIDPFEGMPVLTGFSTDVALPPEGTDVFLFGFPLGKMAVQQGNEVVVSTFKGILSRVVGALVQVDAAVHPGNSGGPLTDANGRVLGIVSAVQRMPEGQYAPAIGYVIPVQTVANIWPLK